MPTASTTREALKNTTRLTAAISTTPGIECLTTTHKPPLRPADATPIDRLAIDVRRPAVAPLQAMRLRPPLVADTLLLIKPSPQPFGP
jgi:hypothetical protein